MDSSSLPSFHQPWKLLQPHWCLHKTFFFFSRVLHLNLRVVEPEKSLLETHETSCGRGGRNQLRGTHQKVPQVQTSQAQSSGVSRAGGQHLPLPKMGKDDTENQLNPSLEPMASAPTSELSCPSQSQPTNGKTSGEFCSAPDPPSKSSHLFRNVFKIQQNPTTSKFLSLFTETCKAL